MDKYFNKVILIAKAQYELNEEIVRSFSNEIEKCYKNGFTPRRTVELIAKRLFK